jgi:CBS domain-containing protein
MKSYKVKDLMVPLAEYATVSDTATLLEAVNALKEAQVSFSQKRYRHRAILVIDKNNQFIGKLSQHDVIESLEPNYIKMRNSLHGESMHRLGFSDDFIKSTRDQYHLWEKALDSLCEKGCHLKVKNIMYTPGKGEFVNESATLDEAIHRLILGNHHSLLVTTENDSLEIVGVLRLTDVFDFVSEAMHECTLK